MITVFPLLAYAGEGNVTGSPEDNDKSSSIDRGELYELFPNDGAGDNNENNENNDNQEGTGNGIDNDGAGDNNENNDNQEGTGNGIDNDGAGDNNEKVINKNQKGEVTESSPASNQAPPNKNISSDIVPQVSKLGIGEMTTISSLDPSNLKTVQVLMNLTNNKTQLVASQFTEKGMEHAVVINLTKLTDLDNGKSMYGATFGSSLNGTNPFTGKYDMLNSINNLLLRNNDTSDIEFNGTLGKLIVTTNNLS